MPDDSSGFYRFFCRICGTCLALASTALLCLLHRGYELMASTWSNSGEEEGDCRLVLICDIDTIARGCLCQTVQ